MTLSTLPDREEVRTESAAERGRLLLVTYSFPPDRRVGALRWQRLIPWLTAKGWEVDVLTLDPEQLTLSMRDSSAIATVPPGVRVFGVTHPRLRIHRWQSSLLRVFRGIRGWWMREDDADWRPSNIVPSKASSRWLRRLAAEYLGGVTDLSDRRWGELAEARGREAHP